jgi:hypothetical protein
MKRQCLKTANADSSVPMRTDFACITPETRRTLKVATADALKGGIAYE